MRKTASLVTLASVLSLSATAQADMTAQSLPFSQNWGNTGLITANDDWSGVPGITGYLGDDGSTTASDVDPQTILSPFSTVDVIANQTSTSISNGGVAEFHLTDPVVALQGSGTADAPHLVIALDTTGMSAISVTYNLRDVDGSVDNAAQQVALQYRIGSTGNFTNVPAGYVADASSGPSLATLVTPVSAILPAGADDQSLVQIRIITTNAGGSDEWIGIDDISVTGTPITGGSCGNGTIDKGENCDDGNTMSGDCCDSDCNVESPSTVCRASVGECDVAETCGGDGETPVSCPADAAAAEGSSCGGGGAGGGGPFISCDLPDTCRGTVGATAVCFDNVEPATTVCRPAANQCDAPERCDGSSPVCPTTDAALPPGSACNGAPSGACDAQDVCAGTLGATATCQVLVQPNTTVCRAVAGPCDREERCNGVGTGCPGNGFLPATTVCRPAAGVCDTAELCTGAAAACPTDSVLPIGTLCRAGMGACDPAETCSGFPTCPADRRAADGTSCADGTTCNGAETCSSGTCRAAAPLSCDDGNACTADACAEPGGCASTPIAGCCNIDGDCADDGDVCTVERCSGTGGTCMRLPVDGCCTADSDCTGGSTCLAASCNLGTNRCQTTPVMGCCDSDSDCDDSLVCTRDTCDVSSGACANTAVAGCCVGDGDCDDGDECSMDRCNIEGGALSGSCGAVPIPSCCLGDSDCMDDDGDACTTPSCNVMTERCVETSIECDDMDACTVDACEADGSCSHTPLSCDDMDECTADACVEGACEHTDVVGCGTDAGMMGEDAGMVGEDAGMGGLDAALPDAGFTNDAASLRTDVPVDAGSLENVDAGIGMNDAGSLDVSMSNCSCRAVGAERSGSDSRALWLALGGLGLLVARRRRRS